MVDTPARSRLSWRPVAAALLALLALAGCTSVVCPDEFARPTSRETFCGRSSAS